MAQRLEETPGGIRKLVAQLEDRELRWKKSPKDFSVLENVCHLRDIEQEGYTVRIAKLLRETSPLMPDINGDKLAVDRQYNRQLLEPAIAAFTSARLENIRIVRSLTEEQLGRRGTLETVGEITLDRLLHMIREHDQDHLRLIAEAKELATRSV